MSANFQTAALVEVTEFIFTTCLRPFLLPDHYKKKLPREQPCCFALQRSSKNLNSGMDVNLKVAVRCRPLNSKEKERDCKSIVTISDTTVHIQAVDEQHEGKDFTFDYCYGSDSLQTKVYEDLGQPIVLQALEGVNGMVFAYGQTGSGKTYTMQGHSDTEGILPQLCDDLFEKMAQKQSDSQGASADMKFMVTVSFLEIHNEEIKDLLNPSDKKLKIREHPELGIYVEDLCEMVSCEQRKSLWCKLYQLVFVLTSHLFPYCQFIPVLSNRVIPVMF
jgi:hypothetical protein